MPSPAIEDLYVLHSRLKMCAALKKPVLSQNFFNLSCNFSVRTLQCFQKKILCGPQKHGKTALKSCSLMQDWLSRLEFYCTIWRELFLHELCADYVYVRKYLFRDGA